MERDTITLTPDQAIQAIIIDFQQYGSQPLLFGEIIRLLPYSGVVASRDSVKNGLWVGTKGQKNMKWLDGKELVGFMSGLITNANPPPDLLATICSRVFQTRSIVEEDRATRTVRIRVYTNIESYTCRQCGRCCRMLDYHSALTAEDFHGWKSQQRNDILQWVKKTAPEAHEAQYRIWVDTGTGQVADVCPFLKNDASSNRCLCLIHDVKPLICREYPISRKHAVMTGCPGFEPLRDISSKKAKVSESKHRGRRRKK